MATKQPVPTLFGTSPTYQWLDEFGELPNADMYKRHLQELQAVANEATKSAKEANEASRECLYELNSSMAYLDSIEKVNEEIRRNVSRTAIFVCIQAIVAIALLGFVIWTNSSL